MARVRHDELLLSHLIQDGLFEYTVELNNFQPRRDPEFRYLVEVSGSASYTEDTSSVSYHYNEKHFNRQRVSKLTTSS